MERESMAETIKETREKYGLSQKSFAELLGIGEATMVRYEQGAIPTRANANLILAAADPRFMQGCFERNASYLSQRQKDKARRYLYAYVNLEDAEENGGLEMSAMDQMYHYTLRQEVLNEQAAEIVCEIIRFLSDEGVSPDDKSNPIVLLADHLFDLKKRIVSEETRNDQELDEIAGHLHYLNEYVGVLLDSRGAA